MTRIYRTLNANETWNQVANSRPLSMDEYRPRAAYETAYRARNVSEITMMAEVIQPRLEAVLAAANAGGCERWQKLGR